MTYCIKQAAPSDVCAKGGFWRPLKLCDTCLLASGQLRPRGNLCRGPVAGRLEWPRLLQI